MAASIVIDFQINLQLTRLLLLFFSSSPITFVIIIIILIFQNINRVKRKRIK